MNSRGSMGKILNEVENVRIVSVQQTDGVETSGFQRMEKVGLHLLVNVVSANGAAGRGQGAGHLAIIALSLLELTSLMLLLLVMDWLEADEVAVEVQLEAEDQLRIARQCKTGRTSFQNSGWYRTSLHF